jgi:hypothetical protein
LFVAQLLAIPFSFYPEFFRSIYVECQTLGLGYAQVNRGYLGYMAAIASSLILTMAHGKRLLICMLHLTWWFLMSAVVFLSGTKGPIIAWLLATTFVILKGRQHDKELRKTFGYFFLGTGSLFTIVGAITGSSIIPCGLIGKIGESRHSIEARTARIQDILAPYIRLQSNQNVHLPNGEKKIVGAEDAFFHRTGQTLSVDSSVRAIIKPGYSSTNLRTWLFGRGFGSANRNVDVKEQVLDIRAGSQNILLDLFVETGGFGLLLLVSAVTVLWINFRKVTAAMAPAEGNMQFVGMASIMIVLLVKVNVAADTPTEDLAALVIGLLIGATVTSAKVSKALKVPKHIR